MGFLRKLAAVSTVGIVGFHTDDERQARNARKLARTESRVSDLELESARAAVKRSQAETTLAQFEANRLRLDLEALHARFVELERAHRTRPSSSVL